MTTNTVKITLTAEGSDAEQAFAGLNRQLGKTQREADQTNRSMRDLSQIIDRSVEGLRNVGLLVGAAGTTFAYMTKQTLEHTAALEKNAQMAGINVEAYQELSHAAAQYQISQDALADGLKEMTLRAEEFAVTGKGPAAEAFERLGYGQDELNRKMADAPALFQELIDKMDDLDKAAQIRIADELFGGQGGEQFVALVEGGAQALAGLRAEARDLGLVIDEELVAASVDANMEIDKLTRVLTAQFSVAVAELAPQIAGLAQGTLEWVEANKDFITQDIPAHISDMASAVGDFVNSTEFQLIMEYWELAAGAALGFKVGGPLGALLGAGAGGFYSAYKDLTADSEEASQAVSELNDKIGETEAKIQALISRLEMGDVDSPIGQQLYENMEGELAELTKQLEGYKQAKQDLVKGETEHKEAAQKTNETLLGMTVTGQSLGETLEETGEKGRQSGKDIQAGADEAQKALDELLAKAEAWENSARIISPFSPYAARGADDDWVRQQWAEQAEEHERMLREAEQDTKESADTISDVFQERVFNDLVDGIRGVLDDWKISWDEMGDFLNNWAKDTVSAIMGQFLEMAATPVVIPIRGGQIPGGPKQ